MNDQATRVEPQDQPPKNLYPNGTDLLWMCHFMPQHPNGDVKAWGSMDGHSIKLDGPLEEAVVEAVRRAKELNMVIQCIRRRY